MAETPATKPSYGPHDVLDPKQVRVALGPFSDTKWKDVKARIPWSTALGARTRRIAWGRLLEWIAQHEQQVA